MYCAISQASTRRKRVIASSHSPSGLSGLPCPCCPPRLPLLSTSPTAPSLLDAKTSPNSESRAESGSGNGDVLSGAAAAATASQKSKNFVENSGKDFGASVAELRKKAQEHSAAIWQSLQLAQQHQNSATATTLANALSSSGQGMASNPFLSNDLKEINFNLLPGVGVGVGGLAGLTGLTGFPPMPNSMNEAGILLNKSPVDKVPMPTSNGVDDGSKI